MRPIQDEQRRKAKSSEKISKSNMIPKDTEKFLNYKDENHEERKLLMNPELIVIPKNTKPYSDGKDQIDQYEEIL